MAEKKSILDKLHIWIEARECFHLSHAQIQMARELGMNPKKLGKLANHRQEPWKLHILKKFISSVSRNRDLTMSSRLNRLQKIGRRKPDYRDFNIMFVRNP